MQVETAFSGFFLQNAFIRVKICFIGHIIVRPNISRSFDIFIFLLNTGEVSFLVQYISPHPHSSGRFQVKTIVSVSRFIPILNNVMRQAPCCLENSGPISSFEIPARSGQRMIPREVLRLPCGEHFAGI